MEKYSNILKEIKMQKEIKIVDKEKGFIRITTVNERWYAKQGENPDTKLPEYQFFPSSTWIASHYPKGIAFYKWLADKGWNDAEAIKNAAGNKGSKVHQAIELLEKAGELPIETVFTNSDTGFAEQLTTEELDCIFSFTKWHEETKPLLIANEMTVFGNNYAGTLDRIYNINGQIYIVDLKTSQQIWEEFKLQVSSYSHAEIDYVSLGITKEAWDKRKMAILQVGYRLNKAGWKFTEVEDKFYLFQMAYAIWQNENPNSKPKQKDYPLTLRITTNKEKQNARDFETFQVSKG